MDHWWRTSQNASTWWIIRDRNKCAWAYSLAISNSIRHLPIASRTLGWRKSGFQSLKCFCSNIAKRLRAEFSILESNYSDSTKFHTVWRRGISTDNYGYSWFTTKDNCDGWSQRHWVDISSIQLTEIACSECESTQVYIAFSFLKAGTGRDNV